jgi:hypothetical protein
LNDSTWTAPTAGLTADAARRAIRAQHVLLRELLEKARALAEEALDGHRMAPDGVASAIGDIRTAFEVHLAFEERLLTVLVEVDEPAAPAKTEHVLDDHRRQRAMLAGVHHEAQSAPELPTLAVKLTFLTTWLLHDMDDEENMFLLR